MKTNLIFIFLLMMNVAAHVEAQISEVLSSATIGMQGGFSGGNVPDLVLDNFDDNNNENNLGGNSGSFDGNGANVTIYNNGDLVPNGGLVRQIVYDVQATDSFGGYYTLFSAADFSNYKYLVFEIRGGSGQENFKIAIKNATQSANILLSDFLVSPLNSNWRTVSIPLTSFSGVSNLTGITELTLIFENSTLTSRNSPLQSDVFIDNLRLTV